MSFPKPPAKIVPFDSGAVASHDIGRQFDEHAKALVNIINFLRTVVRDDGVAKMSAEVLAAPRAAVQPSLPTGVLGPQKSNFYATDELSAGPLSSDYAQVAIEWAEHMPDTIPPGVLAINAITGAHWSARWWANRAAQIVSAIGAPGTIPGAQAVFAEAVAVTGLNTCADLTYTPAGPVLLVVNGMAFLPVGLTSPPFVMSGKTIHWLSTIYSLIPGQTEIAAWYPH